MGMTLVWQGYWNICGTRWAIALRRVLQVPASCADPRALAEPCWVGGSDSNKALVLTGFLVV